MTATVDAPVDVLAPMKSDSLVLLMITHDDAALAEDESAPFKLIDAAHEDSACKFDPDIVMQLPT